MTQFPPPELQHKLAVLDLQERRLSRLAVWRSGLITCCALALGLSATLPYWKIKHQSQIQLDGKKLVSSETIYKVLDFPYPQFIWTINGSNFTQKLESIPSVEAARINKQIIPPKLTINIQERIPVAIATSMGKVGFLDVTGEWVAQEFYDNINSNFALPELTVLNYQLSDRQAWIAIYQLISLNPELKINEVQWDNGGLFIQTKLGRVFLGTNSVRLEQQFNILLKLQNLPEHIDNSEIAYIDLSNPQINLIQKY